MRSKGYTPGQETFNHTKTNSERKYQNDIIPLLSQKLCINNVIVIILVYPVVTDVLFPVVTALWCNRCISTLIYTKPSHCFWLTDGWGTISGGQNISDCSHQRVLCRCAVSEAVRQKRPSYGEGKIPDPGLIGGSGCVNCGLLCTVASPLISYRS